MGGGSDLQRLSGGENVALGCITGVMAKACNYPFLVWKNAAQQGLPMVLNPLLVYRGLPMACLNLGGTNAVQFGATGVFQKWMASSGFVQDQVQVGGAFLGGAASGLPCSLWELCMIQQQRFGGSIGSTMSRLVSEHGAGVLGRGVTMALGRESMFTMSMLGVTPLIQEKLVERSGLDKSVALAPASSRTRWTRSRRACRATAPRQSTRASCRRGMRSSPSTASRAGSSTGSSGGSRSSRPPSSS